MMVERFNLRVYGILIRNGKILLSEEQYQGRTLIKFPGGGVEYGEGIRDALIREWQEEASCAITIHSLFHVTDDFIQSAFIAEDQIVSFYYIVSNEVEINNSFTEHKFFWMELDPDNAAELTFPQDSEVFRLACETGE